ncbi:MAG: hypothetical protein M0R77_00600 [Gammaproteobacteria bacterium]|nr:hypothetical protein [Acholeplasmataceae bacterium]MCK9529053.1 hypothetical protein [Gammaproteobacteria bacterium]
MKKVDREHTTLQTLSTAVEFGLGVAQEVLTGSDLGSFLSKNGRTNLAQQMLTDIQTKFNKELGAAQYAKR